MFHEPNNLSHRFWLSSTSENISHVAERHVKSISGVSMLLIVVLSLHDLLNLQNCFAQFHPKKCNNTFAHDKNECFNMGSPVCCLNAVSLYHFITLLYNYCNLYPQRSAVFSRELLNGRKEQPPRSECGVTTRYTAHTRQSRPRSNAIYLKEKGISVVSNKRGSNELPQHWLLLC